MSRIGVFNHISVDGFFAGPNGETDWFKAAKPDASWHEYIGGQANSGNGTLMFGRTTYEMMKSYWPTPEAIRDNASMAKVMNERPKIVFSKTLETAGEGPNWKNVLLLNEIKAEQVEKLKEAEDITILGSGSVVRQLTDLGLIDEYALAVVPIVLGVGKSMFSEVRPAEMELVESLSFKNGIVFNRYRRVGRPS